MMVVYCECVFVDNVVYIELFFDLQMYIECGVLIEMVVVGIECVFVDVE